MERNGTKYTAGSGDLFIFWPEDYIRYYDSPETPWEYNWFRFQGKSVVETLYSIGFQRERPLVRISHFDGFSRQVDQLIQTIRTGPVFPLFAFKAAWDILYALSEDLTVTMEADYQSDLAETCRRIIENQPENTLNVEDLAKMLNVNRSTLFRVFKTRYGCSPKEFINTQRFEKAGKLLRMTRLSIKEIAFACGFGEQNYFSNSFRKHFGVSPSTWRQMSGSK